MGELVPGSRQVVLPEPMGFREGNTTVHTSRTMMLSELSLVLEHLAADSKADEYVAAVVEQNILGKPTRTTRTRTGRRLVELYALDQAQPIFRLLRHFWYADVQSRPMLAYLAAAARDPLLREMTPFVVAISVGVAVGAGQVADHLRERYSSRFNPNTLLSTARNLASSWTQAGYLAGKVNKKRARPVVKPVTAAFALLLGYLGGFRGKMLLESPWTEMLDRSPADVVDLAVEASRQGWLSYKAAGLVVEISFPGLLSPQEERASHVPD